MKSLIQKTLLALFIAVLAPKSVLAFSVSESVNQLHLFLKSFVQKEQASHFEANTNDLLVVSAPKESLDYLTVQVKDGFLIIRDKRQKSLNPLKRASFYSPVTSSTYYEKMIPLPASTRIKNVAVNEETESLTIEFTTI